MSTGNSRGRALAVALALAAVPVFGACGSSDDSGDASLSSATAEELAAQSERIAEELDAGDDCAAAHRADDLDAAVAEADIPDALRTEVEGATQQLVDQVNCEQPEETTTEETTTEETTTEEEEKKPEDEDDGKGKEEDSSGPPGHGGEPPGQEKKVSGAGVSG
jgi:hypothetical protein